MTATPPPPAPDVRQLRPSELPETAFPGGRHQVFRVFFDPTVHGRIWKHSTEDTSVEICGVLVGKWARDANGPFVLISESIRGDAATNKFAEVTFTHDTWAKINQEMDTKFSTLSIVGWYHSHPGFGIFLSDRDRFIQDHFFSGPGQAAYVVDPLRKTEGVFIWQEGKPTLAEYYWVGDRVQIGTPAGNEEPPPSSGQPSLVTGGGQSASGGGAKEGGWLSLVTIALMLVAVFLLGYVFAGRLTELERLHIVRNTQANDWLYQKIRPGLREEVIGMSNELTTTFKKMKVLSDEHLKLVAEPKETRDQWIEVFVRLDQSLRGLAKIQALYCLTAEETARLESLGDRKSKDSPTDKVKPKDEKAPDKKPEKTPDS